MASPKPRFRGHPSTGWRKVIDGNVYPHRYVTLDAAYEDWQNRFERGTRSPGKKYPVPVWRSENRRN